MVKVTPELIDAILKEYRLLLLKDINHPKNLGKRPNFVLAEALERKLNATK